MGQKKSGNLLGQKITQPFRKRKEKNATFQDKKKSRSLLGQKKNVTQPLRTNKITQPLRKKEKITQPLGTTKKSQPLGTKRIMQDPGTKTTRNISRKNHATSWDKKYHAKSCNLFGQKKNHATSRTKTKIMQQKNLPTYQKKKEKKTFLIGPIASKLVHTAQNCSKWHQICPNRSK